MPRINMREAVRHIAHCEPFQCHGALSGVEGSVSNTGRMPQEWADIYKDGVEFGYIDYTVLSYDTPIAWHISHGPWLFPRVGYSRTTATRHQSRVREAICTYGLTAITWLPDMGTRRPMVDRPSPASGEGAIYSLEYLRSKTPAVS